MGDPIQVDERITRGCIAIDERGYLFIAMAKYRRADGTPNGWSGLGFNGKPIQSDNARFVARTVNEYIELTYNT